MHVEIIPCVTRLRPEYTVVTYPLRGFVTLSMLQELVTLKSINYIGPVWDLVFLRDLGRTHFTRQHSAVRVLIAVRRPNLVQLCSQTKQSWATRRPRAYTR